MMPIVEIDNLVVEIRGKRIFTIEKLDIFSRQVFVLLGPNGAGKTTLLKTIMGFQHIAAGKINVFGIDLTSIDKNKLNKIRRRIGYVPQFVKGREYLPITVRQVIAIGRIGKAGITNRLSKEDWESVDYWINKLGMEKLKEKPFCELSGGQQKKVLIARAMAQEPELLILDEPTSHLDLQWRERIVREIEELIEQVRITVLLVCHQLDVIPSCAESVGILNDGRLIALGKANEIINSKMITEMYGENLSLIKGNNRFAVVPLAIREAY